MAAVTNAGGFGVLGALAYSPEQLEIELDWIDEHVHGKPYGVDFAMPVNYVGKGGGQEATFEALDAMIPEGQEDLFFSLYNVTDRGSSWVGPAVIAAILQSTGSIRAAFAYPLVCLLLPLALHARLDFARGEAAAKAYAVRHGTALRATRGAVSVVTDAAAAAAAAADTELVAVPPGINSTTTAGAAFAGAKPADGEDGSSLAGGRSLLHA